MNDNEYKERCCIRNNWHKCTEEVKDGGWKFSPHTKIVPELIKQHGLYARMLAENGAPRPDDANGKGKGKAKGKGKGKNAAPAVVEGDEDFEPEHPEQ